VKSEEFQMVDLTLPLMHK